MHKYPLYWSLLRFYYRYLTFRTTIQIDLGQDYYEPGDHIRTSSGDRLRYLGDYTYLFLR